MENGSHENTEKVEKFKNPVYDVFIKGNPEELLSLNKKLNIDPEKIKSMSKIKDLNALKPIFIVFIIIGFNFLINVFHPGVSIILVCLSLLYMKFIIPLIEKRKEYIRLMSVKENLNGTHLELSGDDLELFNSMLNKTISISFEEKEKT